MRVNLYHRILNAGGIDNVSEYIGLRILTICFWVTKYE